MKIPFNKPYMHGNELKYISQANENGNLSGDGPFTKKCHEWLEKQVQVKKALLTHSCTAALEMAALLIDTKPGDEIIMPSYTFVSTANAFALRGGVPVFVDIHPDTLNIDERLIEKAITKNTKAIVPVHYAGVSCEMNTILDIANKNNLFVIEDAAQGIMSDYERKPLGGIGHLAALSFHETKNIISGEGGALLINDDRFAEMAEIIREKGTDRSRFFRGQVDKYTWQNIGSSFLPGELIAAFLFAQMEQADAITQRRLKIWDQYHAGFSDLEKQGLLRRPIVPKNCTHNAHMYYILVDNLSVRTKLIELLKQSGIHTVFHYVPLHSSPAGKKYSKIASELPVTDDLSSRLIRLPLFVELGDEKVDYIISTVHECLMRI